MSLHVESRGHGPPLVLLHGWAFDAHIFAPILPRLVRRWTVHAIDLPGHGRSAGHALGTLDQVCDDVAATMPEDALVCGWSLGATIAQRLAVRHRASTRALALVSATPCFVEREDWSFGTRRAALRAFGQEVKRDPHEALRRFTTGTSPLAAPVEHPPSAATLDAGLALLANADLREDAYAIDVSTVVIHGTEDPIVPVAAGRWLADAIERSRWLEMRAAGHLPFLDDPPRFVAALETLDG
jgi:pimeloyl-[acyl-carrier protein] methyl ester esterase